MPHLPAAGRTPDAGERPIANLRWHLAAGSGVVEHKTARSETVLLLGFTPG
jgi:hypothetical protein